ncbi:MAG: AAA family ATPase, partial [Candidatus Hydrothermota bacterium]
MDDTQLLESSRKIKEKIFSEFSKIIIGQEEVIEDLITA